MLVTFADGSESLSIGVPSRVLSSWEHYHVCRQLTEAREWYPGTGGSGQRLYLQIWSRHRGLPSPRESHRFLMSNIPWCPPTSPELRCWRSHRIFPSLAPLPFRASHAQAGDADGARWPPASQTSGSKGSALPESVCQARWHLGSAGKCLPASFALLLQRRESWRELETLLSVDSGLFCLFGVIILIMLCGPF